MANIDYGSLKKGGFMRQKQKGYFSLRLQVVGGDLTAENIRTVAEVADKYGHGYVHMTSRQGIEIPFIHFDDIEAVKRWCKAWGMWSKSSYHNSLSGFRYLPEWLYQNP